MSEAEGFGWFCANDAFESQFFTEGGQFDDKTDLGALENFETSARC